MKGLSDDQFNLDGRTLRDEAIDRIRRNAPVDWLAKAKDALRALPPGRTFTTDELWSSLGDDKPREPRAMGPVMQDAHRGGLVVPLGMKQSEMAACHARPKQVWRRV